MPRPLDESLERLSNALERGATKKPSPRPSQVAPIGLGIGSVALVVVGGVTGVGLLILPGIALGIASVVLTLNRQRKERTSGPHIGLGAEVASDAVIEPGAVVQMGATIRSGAIIRSGAVVRMGATVGARSVIERDAIVSWGADVHADAVVGEGATVGAGADIHEGAQVVPGTVIFPGGTMTRSSEKPAVSSPREAQHDGRAARIDAAFARVERELREAPESAREAFGTFARKIELLRRACHDLLKREQSLRTEVRPEALEQLTRDKAELEARLGAETDAQIRHSRQLTITAIDEQLEQRHLVARQADRLEAEQTRLVFTLEGVAAQLVRLRSAADVVGRGSTEALDREVHHLGEEINAIASALEEVSAGDRRTERISDELAGESAARAVTKRERV